MQKIFLRHRLVLWCVILVLLSLSVSGQQRELDSLRIKFDRFRITFPQEKIYVHLDRELHLTGETLWFKIYNVDAALHRPTDISKVAYVEILDKENHPVLQTKISLRDGEGHGSLFLPASMSSGKYQLRAYTQWMRNFSAAYFFHETITIINAFRKLEPEKKETVKTFNAQFFPEGGNLVYGLKSKVAFQVTDDQGKGINVDGLILNDQNDTLVRIRPLQFGIGNFSLTPKESHAYRAIFIDSTGHSQTFTLPEAKRSGYVMQVKDTTDGLLALTVFTNNASTQSNIYFFIHARQIISSAGSRPVLGGKTTILIPKNELSEGISHITIFDGDLNPQCERLYFKRGDKTLALSAQPAQTEYGIRRKVMLDVTTLSNTSMGKASLSVAVMKTDSLQGDLNGNIFQYLWLSSDLKGEVESPAYYFDKSDQDHAVALDNLMLTHGWRRFTWNDVLTQQKKTPDFIPEYRGHLIRGTVSDQSGKPVGGIATYLSTPGKNIQLYTARSKSNGEVNYEMKDFWGPRKVIVQTNPNQDSTIQIKIHSPYADQYAARTIHPLMLESGATKNLLTRSISMQVQDIYAEENIAKFYPSSIDSTSFYGKANETYLLDDYNRFTVMEEVMREYVPGVMVRKRKGSFHFLVLDVVRKSVFQDNPMVLLDGVPVFDIDKIMEFSPLRVKKLEVITSRYFLGPLVFPGIVSYTTYGGDLGGFELDPRAVSLDYEGLQRQREFYSPQYETQKQRETRIPDRRNLLYWNPQVILQPGEKLQLEFFTSDLTGKYSIVVEGLSENGYAGSTTNTFTVKQFNN